MKITKLNLQQLIKEELIKEFTTSGIDVPRIISIKRPKNVVLKLKIPCNALKQIYITLKMQSIGWKNIPEKFIIC